MKWQDTDIALQSDRIHACITNGALKRSRVITYHIWSLISLNLEGGIFFILKAHEKLVNFELENLQEPRLAMFHDGVNRV